ncbi:MAG: lysine transporter LysE [Rhodospirillales bacterium 20-60-12]|nr:MAG: lysine transporter LysE [Rhodospirillales bacterium 20-60-12]HQT67336.1 LysE family translocator [Acetobacteraceae bacterium]HQU01289.1 LysE family translocator [Acetobacteraceae bacterium]
MHDLLPILTFMVAAAILTITPGVDTAMILRAASAGGPGAGVAAAFGISLGCVFWGIAAAFGLTAMLAASGLVFLGLKLIGAAYLLRIGIGLLARPGRASLFVPGRMPLSRLGFALAFRRGLTTNLLNPKIGIFYITFLPQFIPHGADVAAFSLLLAGIHILISALWFTLLIGLTAPLGRWLAQPLTIKWLDRLAGLVFIGFGLRLAFDKTA